MPRCNGKGPTGHGAMTGRAAGCCGGNKVSRQGNISERELEFTRGHGFGRGFGFGNDNQEASEKSRVETAISTLKNQLKSLEKMRDDLSK